MKSMILVALALVAVAAAAPAEESKSIEILKYQSETDPEGSYRFGYESADGSKRKEEGTLKEVLDEENKPHNVVVVRGTYSYIDDNGKLVEVVYGADEKGFTAEGESIPKPL